ncbi:anti-repressor SinI family protein [Piscibacillus salipiscarius]|uniref:Anti-repressor SinI family protein n=1 Tax=Piscibacillus salipiscarius TaxID=299480 RepID=A0ABW5QAS3_9BACI
MIAQLPLIMWGGVQTVSVREKSDQLLDREWVELLKEARELGLCLEDVKQFIEQKRQL